MECSIYDINLNRIGVLSTWISMVWEESYNADGSFQIEVQQTTEAADLLKVDRYVGILESVATREGGVDRNIMSYTCSCSCDVATREGGVDRNLQNSC